VILSLNTGGEPGTVSHLGIRYPGTADVASELVRAKQEELTLLEQKDTTCCYANADKFWVRDADGLPWEMYTLLADAETAADPHSASSSGSSGKPLRRDEARPQRGRPTVKSSNSTWESAFDQRPHRPSGGASTARVRRSSPSSTTDTVAEPARRPAEALGEISFKTRRMPRST
jgi:hypothetical protein